MNKDKYKYGKKSLQIMSELHKDLQMICRELIKVIDVSLIEGHRGKEKQDQYFKEGVSKLRYPFSKHNKKPSMAVDLIPYPSGYKSDIHMVYVAGIVMQIARQLYIDGHVTHRLRWGGDWKKCNELNITGFWDPWHFELY